MFLWHTLSCHLVHLYSNKRFYYKYLSYILYNSNKRFLYTINTGGTKYNENKRKQSTCRIRHP